MIGNYVEYNPDHVDEGTEIVPLEVILINGEDGTIKLDDGFENYYGEIELNPVKLTPEIFEKAGFESFGVGYLHVGTEILIHPFEAGYKLFGSEWPIGKPFFHVHQLQNLYFVLTGEELEIKL